MRQSQTIFYKELVNQDQNRINVFGVIKFNARIVSVLVMQDVTMKMGNLVVDHGNITDLV